jgi:capsule polysaccharide export protein KpsC/LpsZ
MRLRNRKSAVLVALVISLAMMPGCAHKATPHPNQIDAFDGQTYDTLITAQATLDEAKVQYGQGKFATVSTAKTIINDAGAAYDQARATWQLRRDILLGVKQGDATALQLTLQSDMNQLAAAIAKVVALSTGGK